NDILNLHERMTAIAPRVRGGDGPYFFEVMTYRWQEHVGPSRDFQLGYRTEEEMQPWLDNDQVDRLKRLVDDAWRIQMERELEEEIAAASAFAEESPPPPANELFKECHA